MPSTDPRDPDRWSTRAPLLRRLLRRERPSLLGVQEALFDQAQFVQASLGSTYRRLGHGRDPDRRGEGCPIFWDSSRLRLEDWEQTALSDTPSEPGSTSWGNDVPRFFLTAQFTDLVTGVPFTVINTHFDHRSITARVRSADAILLAMDRTGRPTVVTGDFNTDVDSKPHRTLVEHHRFRDAWAAADTRLTEAWGTFLDYRPPRTERKRIDWILVTPEIDVEVVAINASRRGGGWPSDHAAMQAVLTLR